MILIDITLHYSIPTHFNLVDNKIYEDLDVLENFTRSLILCRYAKYILLAMKIVADFLEKLSLNSQGFQPLLQMKVVFL